MAGNSISISGKVTFSDGTPITGARVRIWETDTLQRNNPDDVIVNDTTDNFGKFNGSGVWRDSGNLLEVGTYKYEVTFQGKKKSGGNITNPLHFFKTIKTPWMSPAQEERERAAKSITLMVKSYSMIARQCQVLGYASGNLTICKEIIQMT